MSGASAAAAPAPSPKRLAILQSNYIPWKGYFDLIHRVDEFVLYDDVQYTRRDWRNRNRIKTPQGVQWLTLPVQVRGNYLAPIQEIRVADGAWAAHHLRTLEHCYRKAPAYDEVMALLEGLYAEAGRLELLTEVNELLLRAICRYLGIGTVIRRSSEFALEEGKNERLIGICRQAGATSYLSGPSARGYVDEARFAAEGIEVRWMSYQGYPEYPQLHGPFTHEVSVLDLLFQTGREAPAFALR